jgi:glycosyltransferase involved in cell wall biosynthesis
MASTGRPPAVLIIVENLPVPFDRRVWNEATTLAAAGYRVSVICPVGRDAEERHVVLDDVHVYRHPMPLEANGALGYALEYGSALFHEFRLAWRVWRERGFDVIQGCNPPDLIFLVALPFKWLFGTRFVFDHHDVNPELFEAKFGKRGLLWRVVVLWERLTFHFADRSIATNESYRRIALTRGRMAPEKVTVVRSGPKLERMRIMEPDPALRNGRRHLVGYVGVIGKQEGIGYLLKAARLLRDQGVDVLFRLCGDGPEVPALLVERDRLGMAEDVIFEGRVPDDRLLAVLNSADVLVNADEANPMNDLSTMNKILEYMALAKPIVQFDLTEGRFSAGEASLYAKANDVEDFARCIASLLEDPARRAEMGAFGRRRLVEHLSWDHEAPKYLAVYRDLIGPPTVETAR